MSDQEPKEDINERVLQALEEVVQWYADQFDPGWPFEPVPVIQKAIRVINIARGRDEEE